MKKLTPEEVKQLVITKETRNVELRDGNELIITRREGKAPDIEVPQQLKYFGNITSPADFFEDRANSTVQVLDRTLKTQYQRTESKNAPSKLRQSKAEGCARYKL